MTDTIAAGQVALVTGASRGIGRAIAATLAAQGFQVVGTATSEAGAAAITAALSTHPGCEGICLNVTDGPALDAAIDAIVKPPGALHVLVSNACITHDGLEIRMRAPEGLEGAETPSENAPAVTPASEPAPTVGEEGKKNGN